MFWQTMHKRIKCINMHFNVAQLNYTVCVDISWQQNIVEQNEYLLYWTINYLTTRTNYVTWIHRNSLNAVAW